MPQMAPMNWLTLFIMFSLFFLILNSMNYFNQLAKNSRKNIEKEKTSINWKW
uniref:ATP synthase complex subunit 8 n=1 Tax=Bostrichoidea sp. 3 KM-2017 TaxID=2219277 RepID=A0A346RH80_9COLE|nr:ATP synthase F0 subunit 8 [Bostrichoidea sp. 3 KM-2017]